MDDWRSLLDQKVVKLRILSYSASNRRTDPPTDGRTDTPADRDARTHLKTDKYDDWDRERVERVPEFRRKHSLFDDGIRSLPFDGRRSGERLLRRVYTVYDAEPNPSIDSLPACLEDEDEEDDDGRKKWRVRKSFPLNSKWASGGNDTWFFGVSPGDVRGFESRIQANYDGAKSSKTSLYEQWCGYEYAIFFQQFFHFTDLAYIKLQLISLDIAIFTIWSEIDERIDRWMDRSTEGWTNGW